jgi:hypothetical protein
MGDEQEGEDKSVGEEVFAQAGLKARYPQVVRRFSHFCIVSADRQAPSLLMVQKRPLTARRH